MKRMQFVRDDGGREQAGYKGKAGDCVCRAIAIATEQPYEVVYDALNELSLAQKVCRGKKSSSRTGIGRKIYQKYLESLGWIWVPCMKIGSGCKVHLATGELPLGRLVVRVSRHMTCVLDGVVHDAYDPQRETVFFEESGRRIVSRCVYGYFVKG